MSYRVIYIPGVVDHRPWLQDKIIKLWALFEVEAEYYAVGWKNNDFESRLQKLVARIDELAAANHKVTLVGVSAGASAAFNAYMARKNKVSSVIFIVGKVHGIANISPHYFRENPAFKQSLEMSNAAYGTLSKADRHKMLYIYCKGDRTVGPEINRMPGVNEKAILALGHISAIYLTILFHGRLIAKFIKSRSKIVKDRSGS